MFVVIYDPPAADDFVRLLTGRGYQAWKRTPFVVQIDASGGEANAERLFAEWHGQRDEVAAELITPSGLENLTRV